MKSKPNKHYDGKLVYIYSTFWKESDGLGRLLRGTYNHVGKVTYFLFDVKDGSNSNMLNRSEWVVVDDKIGVWIEEYRIWHKDDKITDYRQGWCDALLAVIRHILMD